MGACGGKVQKEHSPGFESDPDLESCEDLGEDDAQEISLTKDKMFLAHQTEAPLTRASAVVDHESIARKKQRLEEDTKIADTPTREDTRSTDTSDAPSSNSRQVVPQNAVFLLWEHMQRVARLTALPRWYMPLAPIFDSATPVHRRPTATAIPEFMKVLLDISGLEGHAEWATNLIYDATGLGGSNSATASLEDGRVNEEDPECAAAAA